MTQVGLEEKDPSEQTYRSLLGKMMHENAGPLVEAYKAIEGLLEEIEAYVKVHEYYLYLVDHPISLYM